MNILENHNIYISLCNRFNLRISNYNNYITKHNYLFIYLKYIIILNLILLTLIILLNK